MSEPSVLTHPAVVGAISLITGIGIKTMQVLLRDRKHANGKNGSYNGTERRSDVRYVDTTDCITKHAQNDQVVSKKISEVHSRITEVGSSVSKMQGYLKGKLGE